jgi:hypothetical protein
MWERFTLWVSDLSIGSILLRMVLAVAVGVLIGADRRDKNKGAGVRTHAMVCMGAAMTMIISQYIKVRFPEMQGDVFRLGAAVISGIGTVTGWQWALVALGYLLIAYVMFSGARRLEIRQNKNYGADPEYQQYVKTVPILAPFVPLYSVEKYKWLVA